MYGQGPRLFQILTEVRRGQHQKQPWTRAVILHLAYQLYTPMNISQSDSRELKTWLVYRVLTHIHNFWVRVHAKRCAIINCKYLQLTSVMINHIDNNYGYPAAFSADMQFKF